MVKRIAQANALSLHLASRLGMALRHDRPLAFRCDFGFIARTESFGPERTSFLSIPSDVEQAARRVAPYSDEVHNIVSLRMIYRD
jgi:hypothetical protein